MPRLAAALLVSLALAFPATAAARVRLVQLTSPIPHGAYATLAVAVSPRATCSITVHYKSGPSHAHALDPKSGVRITWKWKVGTRTTPGRWKIDVSCGSAGTLQTYFSVT